MLPEEHTVVPQELAGYNVATVAFVSGRLFSHTETIADKVQSSHIALREWLTTLYLPIATSARRLTIGIAIHKRVEISTTLTLTTASSGSTIKFKRVIVKLREH